MLVKNENNLYNYIYNKGDELITKDDILSHNFEIIDLEKFDVKALDKYFLSRARIKETILPKSLEEIPELFCNYSKIEKIVMPENLKIIGRSAFSKSYISEIIFNNNIENINSKAFYSTGIEKDLNIKSKIINGRAFSNNEFKKINIKADYIGRFAFADCKNLEIAMIDARLIDSNVFYGCSSLETVYLKNVSTCHINIFDDCKNLKIVYLENCANMDKLSMQLKNVEFQTLSIDNLIDQNKSFKEISEIYKSCDNIFER